MAYNSSTSTLEGILLKSCEEQNNNDYWNIDDILAEEEAVPCQFKVNAKGLGYLDQVETILRQKNSKIPIKTNTTLQVGSKVDVPLWLAIALAQREIIELRNPKYLSQKYFNTLKAGEEVVTMRSQSPYIYENVFKLSNYLTQEFTKEAMQIYMNAFIKRIQALIIDHANNSNQTEQFTTATKKLTNLEKEIFDLHKKQRQQFQQWKNVAAPQVEVNYDLINHAYKEIEEEQNTLKRPKLK